MEHHFTHGVVKMKTSKITVVTFLAMILGFACTGMAWTGTAWARAPKSMVKTLSAQPTSNPWANRCNKARKYCEIFQQLSLQEKGSQKTQRLIEFAVGYPPDRNGQPRGVFIMPLGILLNEGTVVSIDGKPAFTFHVRYCDMGGCVAVLDLPPATLNTIRQGKVMTIALMAQNGK
jgi:invasion protein IalB